MTKIQINVKSNDRVPPYLAIPEVDHEGPGEGPQGPLPHQALCSGALEEVPLRARGQALHTHVGHLMGGRAS